VFSVAIKFIVELVVFRCKNIILSLSISDYALGHGYSIPVGISFTTMVAGGLYILLLVFILFQWAFI